MAYDWKGLEDRDKQASDGLTRTLGIAWTAVGAVGLVVVLVSGSDQGLGSFVIWLVLGGIYLALSSYRRRQKGRPTTPQEDEDQT